MRKEKNFSFLKLFGFILSLIFAVITLYPYLFTIMASLRKGSDIYSMTFSLDNLSLAAYGTLLFGNQTDNAVNLVSWFMNTVVVATSVTALTLIIVSAGGYALARMEFPLKKVWFTMLLMVMMIPVQITLVPKYIMISKFLGLSNNLMGLIFPFIFSAYFTFMMRQFFLSFPKDLEEAAEIDGLTRVGVFFRIVIPLSKAPLISAGILVFMGQWNSYIWPKLLIQNNNSYLLSQGLASMMGNKYANMASTRMAAAIITTLPLLILFFTMQKHFMASVVGSGVKG